MILRTTVLLIVAFSTLGFSLKAQKNVTQKRLKLALEFGQALQQGTLSNEAIMKKYVAKGSYFSNDTVKRLANEYLYLLRNLKDYELRSAKYSECIDEFEVTGVRSLNDTSITPHNLKFILTVSGTYPTKNLSVNIDDLYILKVTGKNKEEGSWFILFNKKNKILSFASMTIGDTTGLMQF